MVFVLSVLVFSFRSASFSIRLFFGQHSMGLSLDFYSIGISLDSFFPVYGSIFRLSFLFYKCWLFHTVFSISRFTTLFSISRFKKG